MALPVNLFFNANKKFGAGRLEFDLLMSEEHSLQSTVTSHPVEDGSEINDHIHNAVESGSMTGMITNFSIHRPGIFSNRAQDAFDLLYQIWKERQLVTIVTMLKTYTDMAITSAPVARDAESGESIIIQINFQKVDVRKLQTVVLETEISLKGLTSATQKQVAPTADAGRSVGSPTTAGII